MGRPINKRNLGDVVGRIKVSGRRLVGGAEAAGEDDTYIVSQRSTNKFLVADTSGMWSEILTLVDKDAGSLDEGEFRIAIIDEDGSEKNVIRLYNRTAIITGPKRVVWSDVPPVSATISAITLNANDPVELTVDDTTGIESGASVLIVDVVGTTELNDNSYTVTVVNGTTLTLDGTDSALFTAYTSDGSLSVIGTATIDVQAS